MAGATEGSDGEHREHWEDIDDVDADMDVGAPDQDTAVAEYLLDHPHGLRIEEIEDHGSLGIRDELRREVPEQADEPWQEGAPAPRREELARVLRAEEFADRLRERGL
ncbi:hypothetical protein SUDANB121_05506 [Nocardiopsis dassonvillei]|uniref:hypothetical protein n=1 Tax=Nocardiopsis dassonvillei TaxID=2014 RepID=UPI003F56FDF5